MSARIGIERRNTNETVHSRLRPQKPVSVLAANLQHRSLYPRFLALALVEDAYLKSAALGPASVHAHQHLRPVLGFCPAGAGADLELRVAVIVGSSQQRFHLEGIEILAQLR